MKINWVTFRGHRLEYRSPVLGEHYQLIVAATWAKLGQNESVRKVLLQTGDLVLRPDHHEEPGAPPEWRYFELYMRIRAQLRKQEEQKALSAPSYG